MDTDEAYERIVDRYGRITDLETTGFFLFWDAEVMMPPDGEPVRSSQRSTIETLGHELLADDELGEWLDAVDEDELSADEAANVREVRRQHEVAARIPEDLTAELSEVTAEAGSVWREARADDDFERFAPYFERHVEARRRWGEHADPDADPYEALWEQAVGYHSQAYVPYERVEAIFETLREALVPLIEEIRASDADLATDAFAGSYDTDTQEALSRDALDLVRLDWDRARLDTSTHPFSYGTPADVRVTTRFDETELIDGLTSTLHEFGHTDYSHGLELDAYGTPIGEPRGLGVHESQSRFWENHIARSRPFWEAFLPKVQDRFPETEDVTVDEAYEAVNQVREENLIRVEADELTYHMHIILRTEIEDALVSGEIGVEDVPRVWNEKMDEYLGITPDTDREGCLQDIHWSKSFPGFISYTVGSVIAAQLWAALREDVPDVDARIADGEFDAVHEWLVENVQRHGKRYPTDELIEVATGEPLTADYFVDYVTEKYGDLYDL
jgi:carboxypeptidase Taq